MKILGHEVRIIEIDPGMMGGHTSGTTAMGRSSIGKGQIELDAGLKDDVKASTLMHEMVHVIADHMYLRMTEEQVSGLAVGLYACMKDNPHIFCPIARGEDLKFIERR